MLVDTQKTSKVSDQKKPECWADPAFLQILSHFLKVKNNKSLYLDIWVAENIGILLINY